MLLISIDTLRADRLGCYGYGRDTSPALDGFAAEHAVRFSFAVAESPWTLPSHVSLLSGLYPSRHGVRLPEDAPARELPLLAECFSEAGYYTFGITDGGWLDPAWGLSRGFDSYHAEDLDFEETVDEALDYIRFRSRKGPWFGFLHTYDVHCPYDPPPAHFGRFRSPDAQEIEVVGRCGNPDFNSIELSAGETRYLSDRYDESIRVVDDALASLFAALDEADLWNDTIVVLVSDHGEEFGEHGQIGHERSVNREVLEVPVLIAAPGVRPTVVNAPIGLTDVAPTLFDLAGIERGDVDGRSLVGLFEPDGAVAMGIPRISELDWQARYASYLSPNEHLILDLDNDSAAFFDLTLDPEERENRFESSAGAAAMKRSLLYELERLEDRGSFAPDLARHASARAQEALEDLRNLGYAGDEESR